MGTMINGEWNWSLNWRRQFFVWEEVLRSELEDVIRNVIVTEREDRWIWQPNVDAGFSVKTTYMALSTMLVEQTELTQVQSFAFGIWKGIVPSKVSALA
jgi:hypothetical protein